MTGGDEGLMSQKWTVFVKTSGENVTGFSEGGFDIMLYRHISFLSEIVESIHPSSLRIPQSILSVYLHSIYDSWSCINY